MTCFNFFGTLSNGLGNLIDKFRSFIANEISHKAEREEKVCMRPRFAPIQNSVTIFKVLPKFKRVILTVLRSRMVIYYSMSKAVPQPLFASLAFTSPFLHILLYFPWIYTYGTNTFQEDLA